ncbi:MAG: hypothetical protein ABIS45_00410 [Burkholderiales bacterium]
MARTNTGTLEPGALARAVFEIDIEHCPQYGGDLKIIAAPSSGSGLASRSPP